MITVESLVDEFTAMDELSVKTAAISYAQEILKFITENRGEELRSFIHMITLVSRAACNADGVLSPKEKELADMVLLPVIRMKGERIYEQFNKDLDDEDIKEMNQVITMMNQSGVFGMNCCIAIAKLMMCFAVIDGKVTKDETDLVKKMFTDTFSKVDALKSNAELDALI